MLFKVLMVLGLAWTILLAGHRSVSAVLFYRQRWGVVRVSRLRWLAMVQLANLLWMLSAGVLARQLYVVSVASAPLEFPWAAVAKVLALSATAGVATVLEDQILTQMCQILRGHYISLGWARGGHGGKPATLAVLKREDGVWCNREGRELMATLVAQDHDQTVTEVRADGKNWVFVALPGECARAGLPVMAPVMPHPRITGQLLLADREGWLHRWTHHGPEHVGVLMPTRLGMNAQRPDGFPYCPQCLAVEPASAAPALQEGRHGGGQRDS